MDADLLSRAAKVAQAINDLPGSVMVYKDLAKAIIAIIGGDRDVLVALTTSPDLISVNGRAWHLRLHQVTTHWNIELAESFGIDLRTAHRAELNEVYTILVTVCGAHEDERDSFVAGWNDPTGNEWRFRGSLGFGGKVYRSMGSYRVNCYEEDRTPERYSCITRANKALIAITSAKEQT